MGSLLHAPRLPVPVIPSQGRRAWPKHADARPVTYHTLTTALTSRYPYDAHLAGYSVPAWPRRLSSGALLPEAQGPLPDGIAMVLAAFDVDCPLVHRAGGGDGGGAASDAWWQTERRKVGGLAQAHPQPFAYRSRGGYRLVWLLPEPYVLREPTDREVWSTRYLTWNAYLARRFDIHADPSCQDWTRLFRVPHSTREEGGNPEEWETLGDPRRIGVWTCTPPAEDIALAQTLGRRTSKASQGHGQRTWVGMSHGTGEGILFHGFRARGWLGHELEPGKLAVVCPWEQTHTKGERLDTSTVLFLPGSGDALGWFHCSHAHCQYHHDVRALLTLFTPAEMARAREAAGLITRTAQGLRLRHARGRLRTIPTKEVLAWRR